ncbi:MAG: D-glycerate dehydrogenase [Verrucomicrobiae bacterium]|nr:D-glycerate dehydrogenase [Verrucomicrobiae bacterium]
MRPRVLVTLRIPEAHIVPELFDVAEVVFPIDPAKAMPYDDVVAAAHDFDAIINQGELTVNEALIAAAPRLKIVANVAIGTDNLDKAALAARGIRATNAPDAFTESTADIALGLLLATARKIAEGDRYVRTGQWERDGFHPVRWEGMLLSGKVLGIVGFGAIGQAVARRAEAFGMRILFNRSQPDPDPRYRDIDRLLTEADVVSLHTPLTESTRHLINSERLALMKPGAILINLARGKVVDEAALVAALQLGHLWGAGLDVFENEPAVHPGLLELPNVVLCPHVGGSAVEARRAARMLASENVLRVLRGEQPVAGSAVV